MVLICMLQISLLSERFQIPSIFRREGNGQNLALRPTPTPPRQTRQSRVNSGNGCTDPGGQGSNTPPNQNKERREAEAILVSRWAGCA